MKLIHWTLAVPLIIMLLVGCTSSNETRLEALAQTQTALAAPTQAQQGAAATLLPSPPPATFTPEPTLAPTPTQAPSPTPDPRVIDVDPKNLLLVAEDLPAEGKYYLPGSSWISPHRNSEVRSGWGIEKGQEYLDATGRVDGWVVNFKNGTDRVDMPDQVHDTVVLYKTAEGTRLTLEQYSYCTDPERGVKEGYQAYKRSTQIGDASQWCIKTEAQTSGEDKVWLRVEFIYRNVYHAVRAYGRENEVTPEFVESVAAALINKLKAAPLSDAVTFSP